MNFDTVLQQFAAAGISYSTTIQPYALDLWWSLLFIEVVVTAIEYLSEGGLEVWHYASRLFRQVIAGWFCYWMVVHGFTIMLSVLASFAAIAQGVTGQPAVSPQGVFSLGIAITQQIMNFPASTSIISNLELGIVEAFCVIVVFLAFLIVAGDLLLTWIKAYLTIGLGVILLAFGSNRFTSSVAEGYFTNVIRIGVKILFFYAVLALGMQVVTQWRASLLAVCAPVPTTVGLLGSYYVPPTAITTTVCSGSLSVSDLLNYAAFAFIFLITCCMVPTMASDLVGGSLSLALMHAFEAQRLATAVTRPIVSTFNSFASKLSGSETKAEHTRESLGVQAAMATAAAKASGDATSQAGTQPFSPFNGAQPGYNVRNGNAVMASPAAAQNTGPGQLTYQPGKPGQHTKDIAVDVTDIQNRNGNGQDDNDPA